MSRVFTFTRTDEEGVPRLVQEWYYAGAVTFEVKFFNGHILMFDRWVVREAYRPEKSDWTVDQDSAAIDEFVDQHWRWFMEKRVFHVDFPRRQS